jgi:hypothetical protein
MFKFEMVLHLGLITTVLYAGYLTLKDDLRGLKLHFARIRK